MVVPLTIWRLYISFYDSTWYSFSFLFSFFDHSLRNKWYRKRIKKNTQPFFSFNDSPIPIVFPFWKYLKYEAKGWQLPLRLTNIIYLYVLGFVCFYCSALDNSIESPYNSFHPVQTAHNKTTSFRWNSFFATFGGFFATKSIDGFQIFARRPNGRQNLFT